ncbi:hypothetical protein [Gemmatimonas phototrophica]|uniref:hypothetical protein n=1 Tax=Gemmatimonas phototrophica TaxID=1379270 RepID=UPI0006A737A2|nr:hypothetical protein [Gemmatimonas phototrophica]
MRSAAGRHRLRWSLALLTVALATVQRGANGAATAVVPRLAADTSVSHDPIARLQAQLAAGTVTLAHDSVLGYLPALLKALDIPVSSQTLVFSRTSLQTDKITPWSPRALYFNDDVYVGYVLDSRFLEIGAVDPVKGGMFYTLSQAPRARSNFQRETTTCLMCHSSKGATGGVPGFMVLSTIADRHGYPITGVHEGSTTDVTPVAQRFGGYYVTGSGPHAGNVYATLLGHEVHDKPAFRTQFSVQFQRAAANSRRTLDSLFDTTAYISGQSDVVALMVLTHQTVVHNLIMAVQEAAREAILEAQIGAVRMDSLSAPVTPRLRGAVDNLTRALLFVREARLTAPMQGSTTFAEDFSRRAIRDPQGRSLRDFDLSHRLFKYPCSFLIYSDAFRALPTMARRAVYARLRDVLEAREASDLTNEERQAVTGILQTTLAEFTTLK